MLLKNQIPELSIKGEHVFWRGIEIEHINYDAQEDYDWVDLAIKCRHLETRGITPRSSTVVWHWDWFADMPEGGGHYKELLEITPAFYEHGCTKERSRVLEMYNVPGQDVVEPDGSIAIMHRGVVVRWDGTNATSLEYDADIAEREGIYHAMKALSYHPAQAGQCPCNGPCYASYAMIVTWLAQHCVTRPSVQTILNALGVDDQTSTER